MEDAAYQLRDYRDGIEFNPSRLDYIEQRLDMITSLRRKYGENIKEILVYLDKIKNEVDTIENKDEHIRKLEEKLATEEKQVRRSALDLSNLRKGIAEQLASQIEHELRDLQMERTQFRVQMEQTH